MSRGVKSVLAVVAAVAVPFLAPYVAAAIGVSGTIGTALVGAGMGAASSAATGGNPLVGAALGGFGTYAAGGGFDKLFGGAGAGAGASAGAGAGASGSKIAGISSAGQAITAATPGTVGAGTAAGYANAAAQGVARATALGATGAGAAGATSLSGFFQQVGQGMLNNPAGMAQLALTVYGRPPQGLTPQELAQLDELKGLADTNRELFEQRVQQANQMIQMAGQQAPNPEQAFAETKIAAERQLGEQTRGLSVPEAAFEQRRSAIRSTQAGATAAAAEEARGRGSQIQLMQAGYNMLPQQAPQGYAGLSMPIYQSLQDRRDQYIRDLARGAGDVFGGQRRRDDEDKRTRNLFGTI